MEKRKRRRQKAENSAEAKGSNPSELQAKPAPSQKNLESKSKKQISFESWFTRKRKQNKQLKPEHHTALRLWMRKRGLGDKAEEAAYNSEFARY